MIFLVFAQPQKIRVAKNIQILASIGQKLVILESMSMRACSYKILTEPFTLSFSVTEMPDNWWCSHIVR